MKIWVEKGVAPCADLQALTICWRLLWELHSSGVYTVGGLWHRYECTRPWQQIAGGRLIRFTFAGRKQVQKGFWWVSLDGFSLGARRANWKIWSSPRWLRGGDDTQAGGTKKQNQKKKPRQFVRRDNKGKQKSRRAKTCCRSADSYLSEWLNLHPIVWQQSRQSPQRLRVSLKSNLIFKLLARWHFYFYPFWLFQKSFFYLFQYVKDLHHVQDAEHRCCWFRSVRASRMTSGVFSMLRSHV